MAYVEPRHNGRGANQPRRRWYDITCGTFPGRPGKPLSGTDLARVPYALCVVAKLEICTMGVVRNAVIQINAPLSMQEVGHGQTLPFQINQTALDPTYCVLPTVESVMRVI